MDNEPRWEPCIAHRGPETREFLCTYLCRPDRSVVLVGGAGFDPRTCVFSELFGGLAGKWRGIFVKEHRPERRLDQVSRAEANMQCLEDRVPNREVVPVEIFGSDNAVIGGRNAVRAVARQSFMNVTDVMVDMSALSVGVGFPIVRYLWQRSVSGQGPRNLHLLVAHDPSTDGAIRSVPGDTVDCVHGFKGGLTLSSTQDSARLWLPQLATGRTNTLKLIYRALEPEDTCPILPFPASDPRRGDRLVEEYMVELEDTWLVDPRSFVYADEGDPLDLYRTILRLDDRRQPVFAGTGGTMVVLSPLGSKVMALGALMAALERDLPVLHVEASNYDINGSIPTAVRPDALIHIWLEGDAYPEPRPAPVSGVATW